MEVFAGRNLTCSAALCKQSFIATDTAQLSLKPAPCIWRELLSCIDVRLPEDDAVGMGVAFGAVINLAPG